MNQLTNANTGLIKDIQRKQLEMRLEWSVMKNEWSDMKKKVDDSDKKIDKILHILEKDDTIGQEGLVVEVKRNSDFRNKSMTQIKMIALVISSFISLAIAILSKKF